MNILVNYAQRALGAVLVLAGLLFATSVAIVASVLALSAVAFNLLRGGRAVGSGLRAMRRTRGHGEVVDVQVRQVPDAER